jgi:5-methylcytosine-specific restriction enzyme A
MSQHTHMYQNSRWRKRRAEQLKKEPLCRYCRKVGKATEASVADHITPHRGDPVKFEGPLMSLCPPCHNRVKKLEEGGKGVIGGDTQGNPIDPNHHWNL